MMMKKARFSMLCVLGLLLIALAVPPEAVRAQEPGPCLAADQLLDKGLLAQAEKAYLAVLESDPQADCALIGLRRVAERRCQLTAQLVKLGFVDDAKKTYEAMLQSDPELECAVEGLKSIAAAQQPWALWQRLGAIWRVYFQPVVAALAAIIAVVLIIRLGLRVYRDRRKLKLDVEKFSLGGVNLDPDPSDGLVARVEQALTHMGQADTLHRPGIIDAPVEPLKLPADLTSVPKEVSQLWNFFIQLYPPNTVTLSGVLQYHKQMGAGLSLRLVHGPTKELWGSHTIWQRNVDPTFSPDGQTPTAADYFQLTEAAAVWAYWQIHQHEHGGVQAESDLRRVFGTSDWRSYVANRVGARRKEAGEPEAAERMLRQALTYDRENRHALFNLAMVEVERVREDQVKKDPNAYAQATRYFEKVKQLSSPFHLKPRQQVAGNVEGDPSHVFSDYQLGAIELYQYILTNGKRGDLGKAEKWFNSAQEDAQHTPAITEEVKAVLQIPYAGALLLAGKTDPDPNQMIQKIEAQGYFAPWVLYNLACHYSTAVGFGKAPDTDLDKALAHLRDTLSATPAYARWAKQDPSLHTLREKRKAQFNELVAPKAKEKPAETPLDAIEGISPQRAKILREKAEVSSVEALLKTGAMPAGRRELANKTGLPLSSLYDWVKMADLMRIEGVGGQYAELLLATDVDSVKELRTRKAMSLLASMTEVNAEKHLVHRLPSEDELAAWIKQAKELEIVLVAG